MTDLFDKQGGVYTKSQSVGADGVTVTDFTCETVGSHSSGLDISTAKSLAKPAGANGILIQALTQNVRFRLDGTNPTASGGFQLVAGQLPVVIPVPGSSITVIQETATASLQYQWVK